MYLHQNGILGFLADYHKEYLIISAILSLRNAVFQIVGGKPSRIPDIDEIFPQLSKLTDSHKKSNLSDFFDKLEEVHTKETP